MSLSLEGIRHVAHQRFPEVSGPSCSVHHETENYPGPDYILYAHETRWQHSQPRTTTVTIVHHDGIIYATTTITDDGGSVTLIYSHTHEGEHAVVTHHINGFDGIPQHELLPTFDASQFEEPAQATQQMEGYSNETRALVYRALAKDLPGLPVVSPQ